MVLPPGTSVFKLLDSQADRNVVQTFNEDWNHLYATILAVPDYRMQPVGKTAIADALSVAAIDGAALGCG